MIGAIAVVFAGLFHGGALVAGGVMAVPRSFRVFNFNRYNQTPRAEMVDSNKTLALVTSD